ncbi:MAG: hypothetical protein KKG59_00415 [Nanoarchaeota archaeon]|nr:hypothetical protein [Nanoarchaeota archaeon]
MTIRDLKGKVQDKIPVKNVIVSVYDKTGLDAFIPGLLEANPEVRFFSTGGTHKRLNEILGFRAPEHLAEVSDYTGFPEMEGGLVKTLHPKIHAGILGERYNPDHQRYLRDDLEDAVYIDMVVVSLYPFEQVISAPGCGFEKARGNIDIGGPTMIRGAAKNFPSCAVVCTPEDYQNVLAHINDNEGCTTFDERFDLAKKAFETTGLYEAEISMYFSQHFAENVREDYEFNEVVE